MEAVLILAFVAIALGFLYYFFHKKSDKAIDEMIDQLSQMSDTEYEESVRKLHADLEKTKLKNLVTGEAFFYFGQGKFIRSGDDIESAKYLEIFENQDYTDEFRLEPRYTLVGRYDKEYYITYFDEKPYVSLLLLQTLYLFDESMWRKVLYPIEFIDGLGYNFLEFLQLCLPQRHPDDKWLEDRSSGSCNRFYFKDLTPAEILSVPANFHLNKNPSIS